MQVILIIILVLFLFLLRWLWSNLGDIEKSKKIKYIIFGLVIVYIFTFIIYSLSKTGLKFENQNAVKVFRNIFVMLFSIINSYICLPYIFKKLDQIDNNELEDSKIKLSIYIVVAIVILLGIFEFRYFGNLQKAIFYKGI